MSRFNSEKDTEEVIAQMIEKNNNSEVKKEGKISDLFKPAMRLVLTIGIVVAVLQQITGINSVFFYAPMIFEQSGIGTDCFFYAGYFSWYCKSSFHVISYVLYR